MKRRWKIRNPQFRAFLYLLPALSVIAVFQFYPVLKSFFMGFYTKFDYLTDTVEAVGLDNFLYVLKDPEFVLAMKNTAVFAVIPDSPSEPPHFSPTISSLAGMSSL